MTTSLDPDYHDRKTGLVIFGIVEIVMGLICGLAILLILFGQAVASRGPNPPPAGLSMLLPVFGIYGVSAVSFVCLGIGSILARRWARAILLCFSAVGLVGGTTAFVTMLLVLPHMFDTISQQGLHRIQPAALLMVKLFTSVFMFVVYVVIPGALFLFYRSPHVKRTCEVRDPVERWTDRCPLPVLAYSLVMGVVGTITLGVMTRFHVFPLFGVFIAGGAGLSIAVLLSGLLLYLAWAFYRLQMRAWWLALAVQVVAMASSIVTFWNADLSDMYLKMGVDPRAAAMSAQMMDTPAFRWITALSILPWLVWLLCIRRYFDKPPAPPLLTPRDALLSS